MTDATDQSPGAESRPIAEGSEGAAPLSPFDLQRRAIRGSLFTAMHIAISTPVGLVASAILARLLQPAAFGMLAYFGVAYAIAVAVTELGFPYALVQWGASASARGDEKQAAAFVRSSVGFRLLIQLPLLAVFGVWLLRSEPVWVLETFLLTALLLAATGGGTAALVLQNQTATLAKLTIFSTVAVQIAVVAAALLLPAPSVVWVTRIAVGLSLPIMALLVVSRRFRRAALSPRLPFRMPPGFWRFAIVIWGAGILTMLVFSRSEVFVLRFYGQSVNLGEFALAFGLSQALTGPVDAMLGPLLPASAALLGAHKAHSSRALLRGVRFAALLAGLLAAVLLPVVFFLVPLIFGASYAPAALLFLPLGIVSTLQSTWNPANALLLARRKAARIMAISGGALAADIALALLAIPFLGAWGAVLANVIGQSLPVVLFARTEFRLQGLSFRAAVAAARAWPLSMLGLIAAVVAGATVPSQLPWLRAAIAGMVGGLVYGALIRLAGGVLEGRDQVVIVDALPRNIGRVASTAFRLIHVTRSSEELIR